MPWRLRIFPLSFQWDGNGRLTPKWGWISFSTRRMLPPPGIKQRRLVTGWYSLSYVTGRVMFSMVGSSGYTRMEGRWTLVALMYLLFFKRETGKWRSTVMKDIFGVVVWVPLSVGRFQSFQYRGPLGIGYVHTRYDKYKCTTCGKKEGKGDADYIGPTRAAISIIYMLK